MEELTFIWRPLLVAGGIQSSLEEESSGRLQVPHAVNEIILLDTKKTEFY